MEKMNINRDVLNKMAVVGAVLVLSGTLFGGCIAASNTHVGSDVTTAFLNGGVIISYEDRSYRAHELDLLVDRDTGEKIICQKIETKSASTNSTVGVKLTGNVGTNGVGVPAGNLILGSNTTSAEYGYYNIKTNDFVISEDDVYSKYRVSALMYQLSHDDHYHQRGADFANSMEQLIDDTIEGGTSNSPTR